MKNILIFKIWRHKLPAIAAIATTTAILFWPSIPLKGVGKWLQFFYYYFPQNMLYLLLALLSGVYVGLYVYDKKVASCCALVNKKAAASIPFFGVLFGACPACIPVLAFFLPLSVTVTLSYWSWVFSAIAIVLMLFFIYRMNGFKNINYP